MNLERWFEEREAGLEERERAKGLAACCGDAGLRGEETKEAEEKERTAARDWCWEVVSGGGSDMNGLVGEARRRLSSCWWGEPVAETG